VILAVILVALIVTFIIIKNTDRTDNDPSESTADPSVQAGLNDPDENRPEWQPYIEDVSVFRPRSDSSTVTLSADEIASKHIIMVDAATGKVVCEYGSDARIYPASMTKLMTVIVACELIDDMNETFTFTKELLYTIEEGSSNAYFKADNPVPMVDLIYGAILPSGADACLGLANALAGSEEAFVKLMNEKAKELGCTGTNFTNAIGLHDDNHYSTARDIATIMAYATENPFLKKVITATSYKTVAPVDRVDGTLYSSWQAGTSAKAKIFGAKAGYTPEAGCCLASISKTNDGREYIIVSAEADAKAKTFSDASTLCDKYIK
jgi:D-alanyl-D-alanine carboxypeptidase (penicillin-binding protein 5/6)